MVNSKRRQVALCVEARPDEDIEVRKIYELLPDELAAERGHLRIVDESGEDYLYPAELFVVLELPREAERALAGTRRRVPKHAKLQRTGSARR